MLKFHEIIKTGIHHLVHKYSIRKLVPFDIYRIYSSYYLCFILQLMLMLWIRFYCMALRFFFSLVLYRFYF